jgi:hypothetical protein
VDDGEPTEFTIAELTKLQRQIEQVIAANTLP